MKRLVQGLALAALALAGSALAQADRPSKAAAKGCAWEKVSDAKAGLGAWVQRCDYGFRKIDFFIQGNALQMRYSDGGAPDAVVEVFDLKPGESAQAGVRRIFDAGTDRRLAARCVIAADKFGGKPPAGVKRYVFVPDRRYQKEVDRVTPRDEIGDPPCGDWGAMPDGVQYFEVRDAGRSRRILFVRAGQDDPLFDQDTLWPIAAGPATP